MATNSNTSTRATFLLALAAAAFAAIAILPPRAETAPAPSGVREIVIDYRAHDGRTSHAVVLLPSWYGPDRNPPLPLVISPHGRGLWGSTNAELWGELPTVGGFAVVNPDGAGANLSGRFTWGAPGQVDDLARMPQILHHALPWLNVDRRRLYALGGSMGGQETLLLIGRHPHLLAGAVAVDAAVDFARRYRDFAPDQRRLARREVGGTPSSAPKLYAERTVFTYARTIARSGVPLQIWWSKADQIIVHSALHSGLLIRRLRELNPGMALTVHTGTWRHTHPLRWNRELPLMLVGLGLMDQHDL
jgi:pimeloyl-ACP methyl ester carboxylesterase